MYDSVPPTEYDQSRGWLDGHGLIFRQLLSAVHERATRVVGIQIDAGLDIDSE